MEFVAKPDSLITKGKLKDIDFPSDAIIGGIIKREKGVIARGDTTISEGDHVVIFALPSAVSVVGKFFN
jgi:trk system potassium uptake protein TrkA